LALLNTARESCTTIYSKSGQRESVDTGKAVTEAVIEVYERGEKSPEWSVYAYLRTSSVAAESNVDLVGNPPKGSYEPLSDLPTIRLP